jgi:hypothetical protein
VWGAVIAAVTMTCSPVAWAEPLDLPRSRGAKRTSSLSWVEMAGAESCGGALAIARAVEERLGRHAIVSPSQADLSIEALVEHLTEGSNDGAPAPPVAGGPAPTPGPRWRAIVTIRDAEGRELGFREFKSTARDCAELRDSLAIAISLMIDPDAVVQAPPPVPSRPAPPPAAASAPPAPPSPSAAATTPPPRAPAPVIIVKRVEVPERPVAPARPWHVEASAAVDVAYGVLPSAAVGLRVGVALMPPSFGALDVFGGFWGAQSIVAGGGMGQGEASLQIAPAFVGAALCPLEIDGASRVGFRLCAGGAVEVAQGTTHGFQVPHADTQVAGEVFASAAVCIPIVGPVGVRVGGQIGPVIGRQRYVFTDAGGATLLLFLAPALHASGDAGLVLRLP